MTKQQHVVWGGGFVFGHLVFYIFGFVLVRKSVLCVTVFP